ncbi:MAG: ribosomal protein S18-alanine N-acetyltransferase [Candidatus Dormibacteraceae bacterium]
MVQVRQQLAIEPMREADVPIVQEIERYVFSTPWPRNAYYRELNSRANSYYVVLRRYNEAGDLETVGYAGMWRMQEEAHVTTIGVRHDLHHQGYGRVLFAGLVQAAYEIGAKWVTLEVRATNENAQRMYEGFGFKVIGRRKGYYTDNGEDALVMWSDSIFSPRFRAVFEENLARVGYEVRGLRQNPPPTTPAEGGSA